MVDHYPKERGEDPIFEGSEGDSRYSSGFHVSGWKLERPGDV